jgi:hypothetical protein
MPYRSETDLTNAILLACRRDGVRLWRNETSGAWVGRYEGRDKHGRVVLSNARMIESGLAKGSADLIGVQARVITADDVGKTLGQFVSIEVKQPKGRMAKAQKVWMETVRRMGGKAGIARHPSDAEDLLNQED